MNKIFLFDADGVTIEDDNRFSDRLAADCDVAYDKILPFFENEFQLCLIGKADLKSTLKQYLPQWNWSGTVDELLAYWFSQESTVNSRVIEIVTELRSKGYPCYIHTNNEKMRATYLWNDLGLKKYYTDIFASHALGVKKPHREFWEAIYESFTELDKHDVIVIDDDAANVAGAKDFGFTGQVFESPEALKNFLKSVGA